MADVRPVPVDTTPPRPPDPVPTPEPTNPRPDFSTPARGSAGQFEQRARPDFLTPSPGSTARFEQPGGRADFLTPSPGYARQPEQLSTPPEASATGRDSAGQPEQNATLPEVPTDGPALARIEQGTIRQEATANVHTPDADATAFAALTTATADAQQDGQATSTSKQQLPIDPTAQAHAGPAGGDWGQEHPPETDGNPKSAAVQLPSPQDTSATAQHTGEGQIPASSDSGDGADEATPTSSVHGTEQLVLLEVVPRPVEPSASPVGEQGDDAPQASESTPQGQGKQIWEGEQSNQYPIPFPSIREARYLHPEPGTGSPTKDSGEEVGGRQGAQPAEAESSVDASDSNQRADRVREAEAGPPAEGHTAPEDPGAGRVRAAEGDVAGSARDGLKITADKISALDDATAASGVRPGSTRESPARFQYENPAETLRGLAERDLPQPITGVKHKSGSAEHMSARWEQYLTKKQGDAQPWERWRDTYIRNQGHEARGTAYEKAYFASRDDVNRDEWTTGRDTRYITPKADRQFDAVLVKENQLRAIEMKSGNKVDMRQLAKDQMLIGAGWDIHYVFGKEPSAATVRKLRDHGILTYEVFYGEASVVKGTADGSPALTGRT